MPLNENTIRSTVKQVNSEVAKIIVEEVEEKTVKVSAFNGNGTVIISNLVINAPNGVDSDIYPERVITW